MKKKGWQNCDRLVNSGIIYASLGNSQIGEGRDNVKTRKNGSTCRSLKINRSGGKGSVLCDSSFTEEVSVRF